MQASTEHSPFAKFRTLPFKNIQIIGGFWAERQATNRRTSLRHAYHMLEQAGNLHNLRLAAGREAGEYISKYPFQDSDVYKWLEAASIEIGREPDPELEGMIGEAIELVGAAQMPDGYLNSCFQTKRKGERWTDLDHGHEMYCAGHLIEAGIAHHRATGRIDLLQIAQRFADHIADRFGPGRREATCGHPEIELALIELYRETRERRYLDLAQCLIDRRGYQTMKGYFGAFGPEYHQDRVPVREASVVEGHAVRQLYLTSGVTDLFLETGEMALLEALERQWADMAGRKTYLTGAFGSRNFGEAFGEAYELPSEQAYAETCAAIAAMMWNWRMLLATGEGRFADLFERSLYNGFLSGVGLDGAHFFYENPLQSKGVQRQEWFICACCPPNVMRTIALMSNYLATGDEAGIQIHQYARSKIRAGCGSVAVETNYPWEGRIQITIGESSPAKWTLALRIPGWCKQARLVVNGQAVETSVDHGYAHSRRTWQVGDQVRLELDMEPRLTAPNPHIEALKGSLAIERGPLVYCVEAADQQAGPDLTWLRLDTCSKLRPVWKADLLNGIMTVEANGFLSDLEGWGDHLYRPARDAIENTPPQAILAIPYFAWANRQSGPMRVWILQKQSM